MGSSNVIKVFRHWTHLDHRDIRGLAYMANVTIDQHTPPVYFGGWEALAAALGLDVDDTEKGQANAKRSTLRVLSALAKAGGIVSSGQARAGVRAEYALALDPDKTYRPVGKGREVTWEAVPRSTSQGDSYSHPKGDSDGHPQGDSQWYSRVTASDTPRNNPQEQLEEQQEEKRKSAHPLPVGFTLTPVREAWSEKNTPAVNAQLQTDGFIDYWKNGEGADKTKKNWEVTWRNWMRKKQEDAERRGWKPADARAKDIYNPANW